MATRYRYRDNDGMARRARRRRLALLTGLAAIIAAVLLGAAAMWYGLAALVDPTGTDPPVPPSSPTHK